MVNKFIYNNSKNETIIFFHGLYANSGFWLSYIKYFRNFRLIIYNIDYNSFLNDINLISDISHNIYNNEDNHKIVAVISHSFGTIFADLIFGKEEFLLFNICPIVYGIRIDSLGFIDYISTKRNVSSVEIDDILIKVDIFVNSIKANLTLNGVNLIPTRDAYFIYNSTIPQKIIFNGDHFNIEDAIINKIVDEL